MQSEVGILTQMMAQIGGNGWLLGGLLKTAFLVLLVAVMVWRPEKIQVKTLHRLSCILFALALLIPSTVALLIVALTTVFGPGGTTVFSVSSSLAGVAFGVAVLCFLLSLGGAEMDVE